MRIVTDSTPVEAPKDPDKDNVFALYALFATDGEKAALAARYRAGGIGYGEAKKLLVGKIEAAFGPAREKRRQLAADPKIVDGVLAGGAVRARAVAAETLREVREATGLR